MAESIPSIMERMAPDTLSVRAELSRRAEALAESKGLQVGTPVLSILPEVC